MKRTRRRKPGKPIEKKITSTHLTTLSGRRSMIIFAFFKRIQDENSEIPLFKGQSDACMVALTIRSPQYYKAQHEKGRG